MENDDDYEIDAHHIFKLSSIIKKNYPPECDGIISK